MRIAKSVCIDFGPCTVGLYEGIGISAGRRNPVAAVRAEHILLPQFEVGRDAQDFSLQGIEPLRNRMCDSGPLSCSTVTHRNVEIPIIPIARLGEWIENHIAHWMECEIESGSEDLARCTLKRRISNVRVLPFRENRLVARFADRRIHYRCIGESADIKARQLRIAWNR